MQKDYSQPDFYRFSEDSTKLVHFIYQSLKFRPQSILDIGAGCGVIGLELAQLYRPSSILLIEPQEAFWPYLEKNILELYPRAEIVRSLISQYSSTVKFDLIVSNPPYFFKGEGRVSPIKEKQMSRTWEEDNLNILIEKMIVLLNSSGEGWISLRAEKKAIEIVKKYSGEIYQQSDSLIYVRFVAA